MTYDETTGGVDNGGITTPDGAAPPAPEAADNEGQLTALSDQANNCHRQYNNGHRGLLPYAKAAGEALIEAKRLAGHGRWLEWVKHNFDASEDTAQKYMKIARNWDELQAMLTADPNLGVEEAVGRLRTPRPPVVGPVKKVTRTEEVPAETADRVARKNLIKWFCERLERLDAEQVVYLDGWGRWPLDQMWSGMRDEWGAFAHVVGGPEMRLEAARVAAEEEADEAKSDRMWQEACAAYSLDVFDLMLYHNLTHPTEQQRKRLASLLRVTDDRGQIPPREELVRRLAAAIAPAERDPDRLGRVALVLNPPGVYPAELPRLPLLVNANDDADEEDGTADETLRVNLTLHFNTHTISDFQDHVAWLAPRLKTWREEEIVLTALRRLRDVLGDEEEGKRKLAEMTVSDEEDDGDANRILAEMAVSDDEVKEDAPPAVGPDAADEEE